MRLICVLAVMTVLTQGCGRGQLAEPDVDIVIRDVTVVSEGHDMTSATNVAVRDGRIVFIGERVAERIGDNTTVIDGAGKFLMPGLIDSHTHLSEVPGMSFEHERAYPDIAETAREQIPRSYLYHGFTTVIDLNSRPEAIADWNSRDVRPQAHFCGASPVVDGYPMSFMPQPARYEWMPYFLYDESRSADFPAGFDPQRHSPAAVVGRIHSDGGICVKTHFEKGFGGRGDLPVPSVEQIRALVDAAHAREMPVLLHANSESAQAFGTEAAVDAFAHGMWTWNDRSATTMNAGVREIVDATVKQGIFLQPTIQVLYGEQDLHDPGYLDDPRLARVLPASLLDWYRTEDGQWWRQRMLQIPVVAQLVEKGLWEELDAPPIARVSTVLEYFARSRGRLLFGSDTPSDPTFANPPGLNGRIEMDRWIEAGITPSQLFRAVTSNNAAFFGLSDEIGTIESGKRADLLLLRGNPLESVSAYDTIETVIVNGRVIERAALSASADLH